MAGLAFAALLAGACSPAPYDDPIVLFVSPAPEELDRLRDRYGEDFYVVADDAMWYRAAAYELLDSLQIPHAETSRGEARFRVGRETIDFSWRDTDFAWFLVLYNGVDPPRTTADIDLPDHVEFLTRRAPR